MVARKRSGRRHTRRRPEETIHRLDWQADHGALWGPIAGGGIGAASGTLGGGGGGTTRVGVPGAAGGAEVGPGSAELLQFGQTHSTVHLRTGTSLNTGHFTSLCTS